MQLPSFSTSLVPGDPDAPVDDEHCMLLGPTALLVQGVMGVLVVLSLVYKRHRETPMRPWRIWLFDVSKQVVGQMVVHGLNIGISDLVSSPSSGNNPCTAYFMNVTFDVTVGVGIIWSVLHGLTHLFSNKLHLAGFESGSYGNPPLFGYWLKQASVYIVAVLAMKLAVGALLAFVPPLFIVGGWLLSWTNGDERLQIIFVMGLYPIIMNILQFWLIDTIVKEKGFSPDGYVPVEVTPGEPDPLIHDAERYGTDDDTDTEEGSSHPRHRRKTSSQGRSQSPSSRSLSRPSFAQSTSDTSEPKSMISSSFCKTPNITAAKGRIPSPISVHNYPPPVSRQTTPVGSPRSLHQSFARKRSPPPSPSPIPTPTGAHYGAISESPRMREPPDGSAADWAWPEDGKDEGVTKVKASVSLQMSPPVSKERWALPRVPSPTTRPVL
ncbi:hypothetical protein FRB94_005625 [Tulasnella sp. JGI-2019a]|nr:hypothetical protein FRB93_005270 [Tulasnella sp. JGI-2019a]KAG9000181.1 hypothetical protein FRB94_005625 [Tulasnella sp. JGI-2019a]KAG9027147.1 hypothetical protein FRB95_008035 [Tulasnella sp. JGI-2019a]